MLTYIYFLYAGFLENYTMYMYSTVYSQCDFDILKHQVQQLSVITILTHIYYIHASPTLACIYFIYRVSR